MIKNNNRKSFLKNNDGVALVSVMVVMTVCLLVATIVLELTYTSLLSRRVNKLSNKNFYEAESVVDNLQSVLQTIAVYSTQELKNSSGEEFVDIAHDTLYASSGADQYTDVNVQNAEISKYLFNNMSADYQKILGTASVDVNGNPVDADGDGNQDYVYNGNKFWVETVTKKDGDSSGASKGALTLSIHLSYENENGFLTNISTDLVMNDVTTRTPASAYSLGSYSLFTGGGATFSGNEQLVNDALSSMLVDGNAYIGTMANSSTSITVNNTSVIFDGTRVILNGDVYLKNNAVMFITGEKVDTTNNTVEYAQVDIRGKVYIDSSSSLVISEGADIMVNDIVLIDDSGNQWSIFEEGKSSFIHSGGNVYKSMYPYDTSDIEDIKNNPSNAIGTEGIVNDFQNKVTSGCIMYRTDSASYVVSYDSTADPSNPWKLEGETTERFNASLSREATFLPSAKATFWTYDGQQVTCDAELAHFLNVPVMYWQSKQSDSVMNKDSHRFVTTGNLATTSVDTGYGGAVLNNISYVEGITTGTVGAFTDENTANNKTVSLVSPTLGLSNPSIRFAAGPASASQPINEADADNKIILYFIYNSYTVGANNSDIVGLFMSADYVSYGVYGKGCTKLYSILTVKERDASAYSAIEDIVEELQYVTLIRNSAIQKSNNYFPNDETYDYAYALCSLDNVFKTGITSLLEEETNNNGAGQGVNLNVTNVYDFISTQNWQTY